MNQAEMPRFVQALTGLGEIYNKQVSEILIEIYWDALKKYDFLAVGKAFKVYYTSENSTFFPKPGELIVLIEGGSEDRSIQAWSVVDKAVRTVGPYRSVVFDDRVIMSTIQQMGGWVSFCSSKDDTDHKFHGERFKKAYRSNLKQENLKFPSQLTGIADGSNNFKLGKSSESVALIGNPESCKDIMRLGSDQPSTNSTLVKIDSVDDLAKTMGITKQ